VHMLVYIKQFIIQYALYEHKRENICWKKLSFCSWVCEVKISS
jgi:hypothetical protein